MDETNEKPKIEDDIAVPVVPLVLGGMLTTGPIMGSGILPFIKANMFVNKADDENKDEEEDEQRK